MPRTLLEVDAALTDLTTRVNLIDGQNLPTGTRGSVQNLAAADAGLKTTLNQIKLLIEQAFTDVNARLAQVEASIRTLTGS